MGWRVGGSGATVRAAEAEGGVNQTYVANLFNLPKSVVGAQPAVQEVRQEDLEHFFFDCLSKEGKSVISKFQSNVEKRHLKMGWNSVASIIQEVFVPQIAALPFPRLAGDAPHADSFHSSSSIVQMRTEDVLKG